jgi:hypothetical protein
MTSTYHDQFPSFLHMYFKNNLYVLHLMLHVIFFMTSMKAMGIDQRKFFQMVTYLATCDIVQHPSSVLFQT